MSTTFHHATLDSPRIRSLVDYLSIRGSSGATTWEIMQMCRTTRASSDVSEARVCGVNIRADYERETATGRRVFRYTLVENSTSGERMSEELFSIPPVKSPRLLWLERHRITVRECHEEPQGNHRWHAENSDAGLRQTWAHGATADDALFALAKKLHIRMWFEEGYHA